MNTLLALDQHLLDDRDEARVEASDAMERYVAARTRIAEIEALIDLRRAMGATIREAADVVPLKREASA